MNPFRSDHSLFHETFVREDMAREKVVRGNLEVETFFQAEDDVDKIDRFGAKVSLQGGVGRDVRGVNTKRAG
ncbi:MAG: hypothetical protein BWY49_00860 [Candidatus Omnitrophica bacterium ADurb.Bin314]|nr:MAG: hypothetical protein BWY49_00860 [Candidatus Omnitrophica bacterium ADurb.Bin314]